MKNCDRGLEGRRPWAAFSNPRSQFFTIRTDLKPVNNFVSPPNQTDESVTVARGQI